MRIVALDGYTLNPGDLSWDSIRALGDLEVHDRSSKEEVIKRAQGAQIVLSNKTPLGKDEIDQLLPALKYIGVTATGYNIIDIDYAKEKGVVVTNVPGYSTASVVQLTFALLLELCLHVQKHSDVVREGKWSRSKDFSFWDYPLVELAGKTMGIIGFGEIGRAVADVATAFGMNIIAYSRTRSDQSGRKNFEWVDIPDLFKNADVVSIHCPLTEQTQGLINTDNLALMKSSAFLLNTARGPVIVEQDLADALNKEIIAGAGLDVLSIEPPKADNPLLSAKNCIITPHIAWASQEARSRLMQITADNIAAFKKGETLNRVN